MISKLKKMAKFKYNKISKLNFLPNPMVIRKEVKMRRFCGNILPAKFLECKRSRTIDNSHLASNGEATSLLEKGSQYSTQYKSRDITSHTQDKGSCKALYVK